MAIGVGAPGLDVEDDVFLRPSSRIVPRYSPGRGQGRECQPQTRPLGRALDPKRPDRDRLNREARDVHLDPIRVAGRREQPGRVAAACRGGTVAHRPCPGPLAC